MARFMRKGTVKVWFVPTIAALATMTTAEQVAGTELGSAGLAEVAGFGFTNNPISTPDMDNTFVSQIPGEDTAEQSSLTFYQDDTAATIEAALSKGTTGFIVFYYNGLAGGSPASGDKYEVFPITSSAVVRLYSAGNEAAQFRVDAAITAVPVEGVQGV